MTHTIDSTGTAAVATDHYWIPIDEITSTAMHKTDSMLLTEAKLKELNHD
jgi:hypothetical protein